MQSKHQFKSQFRHRLAAWLGLLALLLTVFAPIVSHALEQHSNPITSLVCTQNGVKQIPSEIPVTPHSSTMNHCGYCALSADQAWMPAIGVVADTHVYPSYMAFVRLYEVPVLQSTFKSTYPAQAPPSL